MRRKFLGLMACLLAVATSVTVYLNQAKAYPPPTAFFNGENLTMKFVEEGTPWYMPIYQYNTVSLTYWQNATSFIPFATYGPHQQFNLPQRIWTGYVTLYKYNGTGWSAQFGSGLTFNNDGVAFADDQLISNRTTGDYKLLFNQISFTEDGSAKYVTETNREIYFTVVSP